MSRGRSFLLVKSIAGQVVDGGGDYALAPTGKSSLRRLGAGISAENRSWLRRMTLSLFKQHASKPSNIMKGRMAGWGVDFLMQILAGGGT